MILKKERALTPSQKNDRQYSLEVCHKLISMPCSIGASIKNEYILNKKYAENIVDTDKYKSIFNSVLTKNRTPKYFNVENIDMTPLGIVSLVYGAIYAKLNNISTFSTVELVDETSKGENMKHISEIKSLIKLHEPFKEIFGKDITSDMIDSRVKSYNSPRTLDEIELYETAGYKNSIEILLEKHLKIIDIKNDVNFELYPIMNNDLICGGMSAIHHYYDNDNTICEEVVPLDSISVIGGSKRNYEDAVGYVIKKKYNVDDFYDLIERYIPIEERESSLNKLYESCVDDTNIIEVDICYWSSYNDYKLKLCFDDDSNMFFRSHKGNATINKRLQKWYKAYYVRGIEDVFGYGECKIQYRKKIANKFYDAYSPVTIIRGISGNGNNTSLISKLRQFEDMGNLLFINMKNEIARVKPTMRRIDIRQLVDAAEIMKVIDPNIKAEDLINSLNVGLGIEAGTNLDNERMSKGNYGIEPYPLASITQYMSIISNLIDLTFMFAGMPRIDAGIEQNGRQSNFQTKLSLDGSYKNIASIMEIKKAMLQLSTEKKVNMIIYLYQHGDSNPYESMFDEYEVAMLKDVNFLLSRETNIKIEEGYSAEDIAKFEMMIAQSNNRYRETQGQEGIDIADNLTILSWIKEHPKVAEYNIRMLLNRNKQKKKEAELMAMQQNMMAQNLAAATANEQRGEIEDRKLLGKSIDGQNAINLENVKHENKLDRDRQNVALQDGKAMGLL